MNIKEFYDAQTKEMNSILYEGLTDSNFSLNVLQNLQDNIIENGEYSDTYSRYEKSDFYDDKDDKYHD